MYVLILFLIISSIRSQIFQSLTRFQAAGTDFVPINSIELIATYTGVSTLLACYEKCHLNPLCRTFVSNISSPFTCRLYESSIDTGGTIVISSSSTSQVGGIHYDPSFYTTYNQPCDPQVSSLSNRYLICQNSTWQCPQSTYWNGSMCVNNVYYQSSCTTDNDCRQDVQLSCSTSCNKCLCSPTFVWNTTTCVPATCPSAIPQDSSLSVLLTFDDNYNGTIIGNLSLTTGYIGQAMAFSSNGYIMLPPMNFYQRSFTIECWIYLTNLTSNILPLIGQCFYIKIMNNNTILRFGFGHDDVDSSVVLDVFQWYHLAFVYDYSTRKRSIYINGISQNTIVSDSTASHLFLGQSQHFTIGKIESFDDLFVGYIDHLSVTHRAKSSNEILNDATLVAYYSFDCGSIFDGSMNLLSATAPATSTVAGKMNEGLKFNSSSASLKVSRLTSLGYTNRSFSFAFWMKPAQTIGSLIFVSNETSGTGWCSTMLGFNTSGYITAQVSGGVIVGPKPPLNVWTHVAYTYSVENGINLYINGTFYASTGGNIGRETPNMSLYLVVANQILSGFACYLAYMSNMPFSGVLDELRIYNREISASEVCMLAS